MRINGEGFRTISKVAPMRTATIVTATIHRLVVILILGTRMDGASGARTVRFIYRSEFT